VAPQWMQAWPSRREVGAEATVVRGAVRPLVGLCVALGDVSAVARGAATALELLWLKEADQCRLVAELLAGAG
jgi:hypothetical protein